MSPQDLAQVNEENLPVYNRCALYALGAAYLNLISQLTTVPAFCQHIHEVGGPPGFPPPGRRPPPFLFPFRG